MTNASTRKRTSTLMTIAILAATASLSSTVYADTVYVDTSLNSTALPVNGASKVLYSVGPISIDGSSDAVLVDIKFQAEVTNNHSTCNVGVGRSVIRTTSATAVTGQAFVIPSVQSNVKNSEELHEILVHTGIEDVTTNLTNIYYNVVANAVSSSSGCSDLVVQSGYGRLNIEVRSSGTALTDTTENQQYLKVTDAASPTKKVLFSKCDVDIPADTIVDVKFQAELTNDEGYNVSVGRQIIRATSATAVTGTAVNAATASNVTTQEHHMVLVHSGSEYIASTTNDQCYNVVVWVRSSAAPSSEPTCTGANDADDCLKVEGDYWSAAYGELIVELRAAGEGTLSEDTSTNVSTIPVNGSKQVVYSYGPITHSTDTLVDVKAQAQITNSLGYKAGLSRQIIRATSATAVTGTAINYATSSQLTTGESSEVIVHTGVNEYGGSPSTSHYYNLVVWATSSGGSGNLTVQSGYGSIIVEER